jgi:hypothetical protein
MQRADSMQKLSRMVLRTIEIMLANADDCGDNALLAIPPAFRSGPRHANSQDHLSQMRGIDELEGRHPFRH